MAISQRISPCLWFADQAEQAARFYVGIFKNSKITAIRHYGEAGKGKRLSAGLVVAIEPMVNAGGPEVVIEDDGWTAVTKDGSLSAHFEHSVAITDGGPVVLSRA